MQFDWVEANETEIECNCPWTGCSIHEHGLCKNKAWKFKRCFDPDCKRDHFVGDGSLGEDIHLCRHCADVVLHVLCDDLPDYMHKLTAYVPKWMKPLENMVRTVYKDSVLQPPWMQPQKGAIAVLAFAYAVVCIDDRRQKIPTELLAELALLKTKIGSMEKAFDASFEVKNEKTMDQTKI